MTIQVDNKALAIAALTVSAAILMAANLLNPAQPAAAADSIKGREYQVVTARMTQGGEGLYLVDNRTGLMAVFTYDTTTRTVQPRDVRAVTDAFAQAPRR